jgi:hypothetical protein
MLVWQWFGVRQTQTKYPVAVNRRLDTRVLNVCCTKSAAKIPLIPENGVQDVLAQLAAHPDRSAWTAPVLHLDLVS